MIQSKITGVILSGKDQIILSILRHNKITFPLMYSDFIEYNRLGNTKNSSISLSFFIPKKNK